MGFNKHKMEDRRRQEAEREAAARRATDRQILEDAQHLITVWNRRRSVPRRRPAIGSHWQMLRLGHTSNREPRGIRANGGVDG